MSEDRLKNIYNFLQINNSLATSGQPTEKQFSEIKNAGYQIVINLALNDSSNALPNEAEIIKNLGMEYIHIPVIWEEPTLKNWENFVEVMDNNPDKKIFVHCAANMRVSAFIYLYRRQKRVNKEEAKQDLNKIWTPNEVWQNFIDRAIECYIIDI